MDSKGSRAIIHNQHADRISNETRVFDSNGQNNLILFRKVVVNKRLYILNNACTNTRYLLINMGVDF